MKKNIIATALAALTASCMISTGVSKTLSAYAESAFSMEEVLVPVWEGTTSYMESVFPVAEKNGEVKPIGLLYPIEEVLEIKSASLKITYEKGVDYTVQDGKLVITPNSKIPVLSYNDFHPQAGSPDAVDGFEDRNGGYVFWKEGSWFHSRIVKVSFCAP